MVQSGKSRLTRQKFAERFLPELSTNVEFRYAVKTCIEDEYVLTTWIECSGYRILVTIGSDEIGVAGVNIARIEGGQPSFKVFILQIQHKNRAIHDPVCRLGENEVSRRRKYHNACKRADVGDCRATRGTSNQISKGCDERVASVEEQHTTIGIDKARIVGSYARSKEPVVG